MNPDPYDYAKTELVSAEIELRRIAAKTRKKRIIIIGIALLLAFFVYKAWQHSQLVHVKSNSESTVAALSQQTINQAASRGNLADVKRHLQKGANVNERNNKNQTWLMNAAMYGNLDVAIFLVDKGADINAKDVNGQTPMMFAAFNGNLNIVKFLIAKGADVNANANDGQTPLMFATKKGKQDVVEFLKQHGAKK